MATGRLGTADLAAATNTTLYTVPANTFSLVTISVCNRGNSPVGARLALAAGANPGDDEWIEYGVEIGAKGVLERTGVLLSAGQKVVAWSSNPYVSVVVYGVETSTL